MRSMTLFFGLTLSVMVCTLVSKKASGQCTVHIPEYVEIVNGSETVLGGFGVNYYVGNGDTLFGNNSIMSDTFFLANGGVFIDTTINGMGIRTIYAMPNSYIRIDSSWANIYHDTSVQLNCTGGGINLFPCSPMEFSIDNYQGEEFGVYINKRCMGPDFMIFTDNYTSGMNVITDFGDGNISTNPVQTNNSGGYAAFTHIYSQTGCYLVSQKLWDGNAYIDSIQYIYNFRFCKDVTLNYYYDRDGNCAYDSNIDNLNYSSTLVEVDSAGVPVDTISCIFGLNYKAYGNVGDIYSFKVISLEGGLVNYCPVSGIITDTLHPGVYNTSKYQGLVCAGNNFDLTLRIFSRAGTHEFEARVIPVNTSCVSKNSSISINYSSIYSSFYSSPAPASQGVTTASWNVSDFSSVYNPTTLYIELDGAQLPVGTPVSTTYSIAALTGEQNISNNTVIVVDTSIGSWDPNAIYVNPAGCVAPGTELEYTITFENLGSAPAENIYVLDTIPQGLDISSIRMEYASHTMFVEKIVEGGKTVVKFNFPDIMLPDSTSPDRHGMLIYKIKTVSNYPIGSSIDHHASIFFDYNPPVLTNSASTVMCWPANVNEVGNSNDNGITLYPNPAMDQLTIKTETVFNSYTISNSLGQKMKQGEIEGKESRVDIRTLPPGIYYISLQADGGNEVRKFVKI